MAEYPRFPMFVDLSEKHVVVVGAGKIAARRVAALVAFTPRITVVAPDVHPDIESLASAGRIALVRRAYATEDLAGADIALAATDDPALNGAVCRDCRARGIPVNVSSDKTLCDFYFPGIVREENVVVGVTASGADHARARQVTEKIRGVLCSGGARADGSPGAEDAPSEVRQDSD